MPYMDREKTFMAANDIVSHKDVIEPLTMTTHGSISLVERRQTFRTHRTLIADEDFGVATMILHKCPNIAMNTLRMDWFGAMQAVTYVCQYRLGIGKTEEINDRITINSCGS